MQKKKVICIIFLALLIIVFMTGCTVWATHESATIGCYSYQIDGILSARANFPYLNYDSDNNGSPDSSRVFARVTDTSTGTVLADVARVVIPEGEDVESVGFYLGLALVCGGVGWRIDRRDLLFASGW